MTTAWPLRGAMIGAVALVSLTAVVLHRREPADFFGSHFKGPTPTLVLPDDTGGSYDLAARRGGVTFVTFGYTHCPDVCPMILADLRAVIDRLGARAGRVQVVFVTLDPKRDTAATLYDYLASFASTDGRAFVGLVGDEVSTAAAARRWGVTLRPVQGGRFFDHTATVVAIDGQGRARLRYGIGQIDNAPQVAGDVEKLLHDG